MFLQENTLATLNRIINNYIHYNLSIENVFPLLTVEVKNLQLENLLHMTKEHLA